MRAAHVHSRGFTLIELTIVAFIIALLAAVAVVTLTGQRHDEELVKEAERLDALFDYVREQAELQTRDYGFRVNRNGYSFVVFDVIADEWREASEDDALRARQFPEGILPSVVVEGRTIVLDKPKDDDKKNKKTVVDYTPQVLVFANGDLSSFEIALERNNERARLYTDEQTNIKLLRPGEVEQPSVPVRAVSR
ncbi:MAG TPA: type II secretion system minor pseudopilin GspH [Steroidobacteraceae bacterium]|nr:type II secretion system minor pseudopilin GspH [Steroidobacteraceae bacterium]